MSEKEEDVTLGSPCVDVFNIAEGPQAAGSACGKKFGHQRIDRHCEIWAAICGCQITGRRAGSHAFAHRRLGPSDPEEIVVDTADIFVIWELLELLCSTDNAAIDVLGSNVEADIKSSAIRM